MAEEELAANASLEHGSVSIGASETALNIYLLEKLKAFHTEYPGIRLKMYNHSTPQAVRSVGNGEIDFAVVTTPTNAEPPLQEVHLQSFREILVGGLAYTALASQELTLSDLEHYSFISLGKETMTYRFYHQLFLSPGAGAGPRHRGGHRRPDPAPGAVRLRACLHPRNHGPGGHPKAADCPDSPAGGDPPAADLPGV